MLVGLSTPALAQFPPPGIYQCRISDGQAYGTLTLLVDGDYSFTDATGLIGAGQLASAGTDVTSISGPLAAQGIKGSFATTEDGSTEFVLVTTDHRAIVCR